MIRHIWSVLCQSASFDAQFGSVSLQNIIETVVVFREPSSAKPGLISAELVSLWYRQPDETPVSGQMRAFYTSPNGEAAESVVLEIPSDASPFHHTRLTMSGFPVFQTGLYLFHVELQLQGETEWKTITTVPLMVVSQPLPPVPPK